MRTLNDVPEDVRMSHAQTVNEQDLPWKANAYTQVDMEALDEQSNRPEFGFAQVRGGSFGTESNFESTLEEV